MRECADITVVENVQTHDGAVGEGYFRHALFHPLQGETKKEAEGIRMRGYVPPRLLIFSGEITRLKEV